MSTWQIFSDPVNIFCWEIGTDQHLKNESIVTPSPPSNSVPLPSMEDLLLQGCSKLAGNHGGDFKSSPNFQSGLGKPVTVKQSSITKALSILSDEGDTIADRGCSKLTENYPSEFQSPPLLQSGFGKSITGKQFSITKAPSVRGDEGDSAFQNQGHLLNGSDKGSPFPNSMFQTASGKKVNICSAGIVRAKALLGLQEHYDCDDLFGTGQSKNQSNELFGGQNSFLETEEGANTLSYQDATPPPLPMLNVKNISFQSDVKREPVSKFINSGSKCPPIKFQSAGGRSFSVSNDALQRAKGLLGDLEHGSHFDEDDATYPSFSFREKGGIPDNSSNNNIGSFSSFNHLEVDKSKCMANGFVSPLRSFSNQRQSSVMSEKLNLRNNLMDKFDSEDHKNIHKTSDTRFQEKIPSSRPIQHIQLNNHSENAVKSTTSRGGGSLGVPLGDISNKLVMADKDHKINGGLKRRLVRSSVSQFKKPRNSRFVTPLKNSVSAPSGRSSLGAKESFSRRRLSNQYPFQGKRKYVKEYFGMPLLHTKTLKELPDHVRSMSSENAEKYLFPDAYGVECIGAEAFYHMLIQSGASMEYCSKRWVANHYKWIVWKLACYERCCPYRSSGKLFTVNNVLQELKLRYEREVNHGQRSAIKRILEGDQPPSSVVVLCISAIRSNHYATPPTTTMSSNNIEQSKAKMVEVTDGWYSINAFLDVHLSKKLAVGKLFVGQKLRICGAELSGWEGPISPLEESCTAGLLLHINGTYRAHWATRLGLCKAGSAPLAFRCIKGMGGPVPSTLVGVTRIYPVQYREKLSNGGFIVRSDRMEAKIVQLYNQRRSTVAEGVVSEFQDEIRNSYSNNDSNSEEGAKILKILETAAEPELIMAGMSSEQLSSFTSYKAKLEEIRQSEMLNSIETALEAAGLGARDVTPFMRVRVVGLTSENSPKNCKTTKGIITIWIPCDKQQSELVEGKTYAVTGLTPLNMEADTLYLQARGPTSKWVPLSIASIKNFEPFFDPRRSVSLSELGEIPLSSEFDIAAYVIYVGDVYTDVHQKKQWVFVADGSISESLINEPPNSLLAISFCSPCVDCVSGGPVSNNLVGSSVGFCNLIKRATDQINHIWVAEATANSTYFLNYDGMSSAHLKEAATSANRWAKMSSSTIEKLRQKVLYIIDDKEG